MSNQLKKSTTAKTSLIERIADRYHVDPIKMLVTLKATAFKQKDTAPEITNEQMMSLMVVADQYKLNPFTREIYAFAQNGGIVPIVPIDGWMSIINNNQAFDGMDFDDKFDDDGNIVSITCKMYRKDRSHAVEVTEYLRECKKSTIPWNTWPVRMLRHKATIQCARYAFGFSGIFDEDEADRIRDVNDAPRGTSAAQNDAQSFEETVIEELPTMTDEVFTNNLAIAKTLITSKKKTAVEVVDMMKTKYSMTVDQENNIYAIEDLINENA